MFPTAMEPFPWAAASIPTASSGLLVPNATKVSPTMSGETPSLAAMAVPLRTIISAPATSTIKPATTNATDVSISIVSRRQGLACARIRDKKHIPRHRVDDLRSRATDDDVVHPSAPVASDNHEMASRMVREFSEPGLG